MPFYLMVGIPYGVINLWIVCWFWRALRGSGAIQVFVCLAIVGLALCFPFAYKRPGDSLFAVALVRLGAAWLGVFLYLFFAVLLLDAGGLLFRLLGKAPATTPRYLLCFFIFFVSAGIGFAGWINAAKPVAREYSLDIKVRGPALAWEGRSLTLAAIADMHLGRTITAVRLERALALLAPYKPDAVLFLGDILDDHFLLDTAAMAAAVKSLEAPLGVWGIVGNHEYIAGSVEESIAILEDAGITILRDEWTNLGGILLVAGRDDFSRDRFTGEERRSLPDILRSVPASSRALPLLVLDHQPRNLEEAQAAGAALQLSGHTHNGQLWPFNYVISQIYEVVRGLYVKGNTSYVVTVGAGTWGPPMRTNARPEVIVLRLNFMPEE